MRKATREAYGEALAELMLLQKDIIVLDADLTKSTKTNLAKQACAERHFNMGIAEANMMGVAAGFAASGFTVFASSFAMFATGRAWEQIRNSIAYPQLNVKICGTHAGISVGEDGVSHQAIEDIALMRSIPGMEVYSPCDEVETKAVIHYVAKHKNPCYVRLGRGEVSSVYCKDHIFNFKKINEVSKGETILIFATGLLVQVALKAKAELKKFGIYPTVVDVCCLKPLDEEGIISLLRNHEYVITAEEHNVIGGLGSAISDICSKSIPKKIVKLGLQDSFAESGPFEELLDKYHLNIDAIVDVCKSMNICQ